MKFSARALLISVAVTGLAGCNTLEKMHVLQPKVSVNAEPPGTIRLPLVAPDQQVSVAPALQGVGFFLPPPAPMDSWPLPGGTPEQSVEHVAAAPAFQIAWKRKVGRSSSSSQFITAPPVVVGGRIYTLDAAAKVTATNAVTGAPLWAADLTPRGRDLDFLPTVKLPFIKASAYEDYRAFGGGLAYDAGRLYVTSGYRFVAALDAGTGAQIWRASGAAVPAPIHSAPTVGNGKVFAVNTNNELQSFNTADGSPGCQYEALVEPARILQASSPALSGTTVVASFASGEISAIQSSNCTELWTGNLTHASRTTALSEIRDIAGRPIIYKGDVYAGGHSGAFAAIDLRTGQPRWQLPIITTASPWAAGDVVYIVSKAGEVICISRQTGQIFWISDLNAKQTVNSKRSGFLGLGNNVNTRTYWTGVILASNRLITVSSAGYAAALDPKTGAIEKTLKLGAPALITPIAAGGLVYIMLDNGELVALR